MAAGRCVDCAWCEEVGHERNGRVQVDYMCAWGRHEFESVRSEHCPEFQPVDFYPHERGD